MCSSYLAPLLGQDEGPGSVLLVGELLLELLLISS
jgi:hypothetical protein